MHLRILRITFRISLVDDRKTFAPELRHLIIFQSFSFSRSISFVCSDSSRCYVYPTIKQKVLSFENALLLPAPHLWLLWLKCHILVWHVVKREFFLSVKLDKAMTTSIWVRKVQRNLIADVVKKEFLVSQSHHVHRRFSHRMWTLKLFTIQFILQPESH